MAHNKVQIVLIETIMSYAGGVRLPQSAGRAGRGIYQWHRLLLQVYDNDANAVYQPKMADNSSAPTTSSAAASICCYYCVELTTSAIAFGETSPPEKTKQITRYNLQGKNTSWQWRTNISLADGGVCIVIAGVM